MFDFFALSQKKDKTFVDIFREKPFSKFIMSDQVIQNLQTRGSYFIVFNFRIIIRYVGHVRSCHFVWLEF